MGLFYQHEFIKLYFHRSESPWLPGFMRMRVRFNDPPHKVGLIDFHELACVIHRFVKGTHV